MPLEIDLKRIWQSGLCDRPLPMKTSRGIFVYLARARGQKGRTENSTGVSLLREEALLKATMESIERTAFLNCENFPIAFPLRKSKLKPDFQWTSYRWFKSDQLQNFPETRNLKSLGDVKWLEATEMTKSKRTLVPEFCLSNRTFPFYVEDSTNGWAAGPHPEFAIRGATLELIERDAFLYHWLTKKPPQELKLKKSDMSGLEAFLAVTGFPQKVKFLRFPSPSGAIVVGASLQQDVEPYFLMGLGAGLDGRSALQKSLCELAALTQLRISSKDRNRLPEPIRPNDNIITPTDHLLYYAVYRRDLDLSFLLNGQPLLFSDLKTIKWEAILSNLRRKGHRVYAIDATTPQMKKLNLSVVKCFSPTLLGIEFKHRNQNLGSERLASKTRLNQNPHPFA